MRRRSGFGWLEFIEGLLLILLGIFTCVHPGSILEGFVILYGLLAVVTGIGDLVFYVKMEQHMGFGPSVSLIAGLLSVMAGFMLLVHPDSGKWIIALLVPIWFIAHCISRLSHLNIVRFVAGNAYYYFSLVINTAGLVLAVLMIVNPGFSVFSIGVLMGVYLLLLGIDCLITAFSDIGGGW